MKNVEKIGENYNFRQMYNWLHRIQQNMFETKIIVRGVFFLKTNLLFILWIYLFIHFLRNIPYTSKVQTFRDSMEKMTNRKIVNFLLKSKILQDCNLLLKNLLTTAWFSLFLHSLETEKAKLNNNFLLMEHLFHSKWVYNSTNNEN